MKHERQDPHQTFCSFILKICLPPALYAENLCSSEILADNDMMRYVVEDTCDANRKKRNEWKNNFVGLDYVSKLLCLSSEECLFFGINEK